MKSPSQDTYDLIKSLTGHEKKYFRQFALRHSADGKPVYMQLFEAIEKQILSLPAYNEDVLRQKLGLSTNRLSVEKNTLSRLILRSLIEKDDYMGISTKLSLRLGQVELLIQKGLFEQASRVLMNSMDEASLFQDLPEIEWRALDLELQINRVIHPNFVTEYIPIYQHRLLQTSQRFTVIARLGVMHTQLFYMLTLHTRGIKSPTSEELEAISNDPYFTDVEAAQISPLATERFYAMRYRYFTLVRDTAAAHRESSLIIKHFDKFPQWRDLHKWRFIAHLHNHILCCVDNSCYAEALFTLDRMANDADERNEGEYIRKYEGIHSLRLEILCIARRYKEAVSLIKDEQSEISIFVKKYKDKMELTKQYAMAILSALNLVGDKQFDEALNYISRALQHSRITEFPEYHLDSRMIAALCHFELHNNDFLIYELTNIQRLIDRFPRPKPLEKLVVRYWRDFVNLRLREPDTKTRHKTKQAIWIEFEKDLQAHKDMIRLDGINYFEWVTSKIVKEQ